MSWNYISSIHKSYAVSNSLMCNVEVDKKIQPRLLISRSNILEFFIVNPDGIKLDFQIELFAKIIKICEVKTDLKSSPSLLFLLASNSEYGFVTIKDKQIVTKHNDTLVVAGSSLNDPMDIKVAQEICRSDGQTVYLHFTLYAFRGLFLVFVLKVLQNSDIIIERTPKIRFQYDKIKDIGIVANHTFKTKNSLLAVLYEEDYGNRIKHFQVYELNWQTGELVREPCWKIAFNDDTTVYKIECLKDGGLIVFSQECISLYLQGTREPAASVQTDSFFDLVAEIPTIPGNFLALENREIEEKGGLFLISLTKPTEMTTDKKNADQLTLKYLGTVSVGTALTPIAFPLIFIGSQRDNSTVYSYSDEITGNQETPYLTIIDSFLNLGVITDLRFVKSKNNIASSLITASGSKRTQQVNILSSGMSIQTEDNFKLPQVKNFWLLKGYEEALLFISTTLNSYSLKVNKKDSRIAKNTLSGFIEKLPTINIHQQSLDIFLQVTSQGVALFHVQEMKIVHVESTKSDFVQENGEILLSVHFDRDLYLLTTKDLLLGYNTRSIKLEKKQNVSLVKQPSSMHANKKHLFMSFWNDKYLHVYDRETLTEVHSINVDREGISSVISTNLGSENNLYLFVGFLDGLVKISQYTFMQDGKDHNIEVSDKKSYRFGSQPIVFQEANFKEKKRIFALSDNSALFYLNEQGQPAHLSLLIANVRKLTLFEEFEENTCFTLIDGELGISKIELYDKVQAKHLPIESGCEVKLILPYLEESVYVAAVQATDQAISYLKCYDSNSYLEIDDPITYEDMEITSLLKFEYEEFRGILVSLAGQASGLVDIYEFTQNRLNHKQSINYAKEALVMARMLDRYVAVAVKSTIVVLEIEKVKNEENENFDQQAYHFAEIATKAGFSLIQHIETYNNYVLVVDNIKGLHLFSFDTEDYKFVLVSVSMKNALGSRVGCIVDENLFVLSTEGIIRIFKKTIQTEADTQRTVLTDTAVINMGEEITCMIKDKVSLKDRWKLESQDSVEDQIKLDYIIVSGCEGSVNLIAIISEKYYNLFLELQTCIIENLPKGFGYDHSKWRSSKDPCSRNLSGAKGFIDGEVLKRVLTMSEDELKVIYEKIKVREKPHLHDMLLMIEDINKIV